eukprot:3773389-Ditylum_brightwellii.AAC.1
MEGTPEIAPCQTQQQLRQCVPAQTMPQQQTTQMYTSGPPRVQQQQQILATPQANCIAPRNQPANVDPAIANWQQQVRRAIGYFQFAQDPQ